MRLPEIRTAPSADIQIPVEFQRLYDLAYNLWWTWSSSAQTLFQRIDPIRWSRDHNPVELLINVEPHRWDALLLDRDFIESYRHVVEEFERYLDGTDLAWFYQNHPQALTGPIAYFSAEYGWHECLSVYSGGLGILAGDHCKSASDLGLPFIGIGLMYRRGYFHQTIDADGHQQHHYEIYDFRRVPILPVVAPNGRPIHVSVDLPDRKVQLRLWKANVGRATVILLDSDVRENDPADRPITSVLYIRGREMRLCQEILLGIGGVRSLRALGVEPSVWHMNEGHSALIAFERMRELIQAHGKSFDEARRIASANTVFTTHTPVPAGNETFAQDLLVKYLGPTIESWGVEVGDFLKLGDGDEPESGAPPAEDESTEAEGADDAGGPQEGESTGAETGDDPDGSGKQPGESSPEGSEKPSEQPSGPHFNLTAFALRTSNRANGVSELHGRVADEMWSHLTQSGEESPSKIDFVTNGVHAPSWIGLEVSRLLSSQLGPDFHQNLDHPAFEEQVLALDPAQLWNAHQAQKDRLLDFVRNRSREQFARHGKSPDELRKVGGILRGDALTIGFARRFATYKRASLILRDLDRLRGIVRSEERPVQILFAGKAHPADRPGQDLIRQIYRESQTPELAGRVVFLEDYNIRTARYLVQGVDLWLNTPRRPLEASGTSGMKAALNGVLNFSVLDGWWAEGFDPSHGWAMGDDNAQLSEQEQDDRDSQSLYTVLSEQIVPCFFNFDGDLPLEWINRMKKTLATLAPRFNTARMVRQYVEGYYLPVAGPPPTRPRSESRP